MNQPSREEEPNLPFPFIKPPESDEPYDGSADLCELDGVRIFLAGNGFIVKASNVQDTSPLREFTQMLSSAAAQSMRRPGPLDDPDEVADQNNARITDMMEQLPDMMEKFRGPRADENVMVFTDIDSVLGFVRQRLQALKDAQAVETLQLDQVIQGPDEE